jgi:hypothetical protein
MKEFLLVYLFAMAGILGQPEGYIFSSFHRNIEITFDTPYVVDGETIYFGPLVQSSTHATKTKTAAYRLHFENPDDSISYYRKLEQSIPEGWGLPVRKSVNGFQIITYINWDECNSPTIIVMGNKHNYRFTTGCGHISADDIAYFESFLSNVKFLKE